MSAWIVSPRHIDYLVEVIRHLGITDVTNPNYTDGRAVNISKMSNTALGAMLMWENVRSVSERYPYDTFESLPGPVDKKRVVPYRYRKSGLPFNVLAVLKAALCYDYQSCEHGYWRQSISFAVIQKLTEAAEAALLFRLRRQVPSPYGGEGYSPAYIYSAEYGALPWGIEPDTTFGEMPGADPEAQAVVEAEAIIRGWA